MKTLNEVFGIGDQAISLKAKDYKNIDTAMMDALAILSTLHFILKDEGDLSEVTTKNQGKEITKSKDKLNKALSVLRKANPGK